MESFASSSGGVHALSESHHPPRRSRAKARLLWRSDLVLIDGTQLPGVAIVSYSNPFGEPAEDDSKHHGARANLHEAEADLCLALEMLRNQPLRIASVAKHRGPEAKTALPAQRQTHWVASGEVRVYIDPKESATWAFFQRIFCFEADFLTDADDERSAQVLTVSLQPSLHAPSAENSASDPFATVHTPTAPHSDLPSLHSQYEQPKATGLQQMLRPRPSVSSSVGGSLYKPEGRSPADSSRGLSRSRSFHRQQSIGSQSLQDVFSQAGLTLPMLGGLPFPSATLAPRPDDPLPRGSISALLQARSKRSSGQAERSRAVSPARSPSVAPLTITGVPHTPGRGVRSGAGARIKKSLVVPHTVLTSVTSKMLATHRRPRPSSDTLTASFRTSLASILASSRCVHLSLPLETARICSTSHASRSSPHRQSRARTSSKSELSRGK